MAIIEPELCEAGHIKRDPVTGSSAIRTSFSDTEYPELSWLIATQDSGALTRPHAYVEGWEDMYVTDGGPVTPPGDSTWADNEDSTWTLAVGDGDTSWTDNGDSTWSLVVPVGDTSWTDNENSTWTLSL